MSLSPDARLLRALADGRSVTQRSLSRELGMALGLTNLLIKRLVSKGYVQVTRLRPRHVRYLLTAEGQRALADLTRISLQNTVSLYTDTRDQIRAGLEFVAREAHASPDRPVPVVFYGLGDVAEIAFVSLQLTPLRLVGAVDDYRTAPFFGLPVLPASALCDSRTDVGRARVIVTTIRRASDIRLRVSALGVPDARVTHLDAVIAHLTQQPHV